MRKIKNYRRLHGYDYSRGANLFLTCSLKPRRPLMARIEGDRALLTPVGEEVARCLAVELDKMPQLVLMAKVMMHDHIHLLVHLRAGEREPLKILGRFIQNFKRWAKYYARKRPGAADFGWELNYHDRICVSREIADRAAKYIANNPLKWTLMHGDEPMLRVVEPLEDARIPNDEWWSGVGAVELLRGRIAAVRLSTKIKESEFEAVVRRCLSATEKGYVLAGTFISPCEQRLWREIVARGLPVIKMIPDELATVYRPKDDEPRMFAEGRYLLLSRLAAKTGRRFDAWHGINAALAGLAVKDGVSLYVRRADDGAALQWDFEAEERT